MAARNIATEIQEIRGRNPHGVGIGPYRLQSLSERWKKQEESTDEEADFFIIRMVTILEVSTRRHLAALVDCGEPYISRATKLSKNLRIDYELVSRIQGRTITLGDVVGQSASINTFDQLCSIYSTLFDSEIEILFKGFYLEQGKAEDTSLGEPNFGSVAQDLSNLFKLRHILVHELPTHRSYKQQEIRQFISSARLWSNALDEIVHVKQYGRPAAYTQVEMNEQSAGDLQQAEEEMQSALKHVRDWVAAESRSFSAVNELLPEHQRQSQEVWLTFLERAQDCWTEYQHNHCQFTNYLSSTGTIYSLLYATEAELLVRARTNELRTWLGEQQRLML